MRTRVYFGKVCPKHPAFNGERFFYNRHCVECDRQFSRERYQRDPAKHNARCKQWREQNADYQAARCRAWHAENREHNLARCRAYDKANREAILLRKRKNREASCENR